jgi:hypothetical protein
MVVSYCPIPNMMSAIFFEVVNGLETPSAGLVSIF